jgi:truncated hemoglobin YjbI
MSSKAKEEVNVRPSFESLMDDDSRISFKLASLASNTKSKVFGVLDSFLSSMKTYDEKKAHNMLALMLDPRFKNFHFVFSYVGKE